MSENKGPSFGCATCGKTYSRKDFLARHELNHKGIRPFKCDRCNLHFTRRDMLVKHYKSNSHKKLEQGEPIVNKNNNGNGSGSSLRNEITHSLDSSNLSTPKRRLSPPPPSSTSQQQQQQHQPSIKPDFNQSTNVKKLRIANFLNDYDEKIYTPPLQPTIIRPSSASGTLSGGSVDVNFGNLISTKNDPSRNDNPQNKLPSGYIKRRFASKYNQKLSSSSDEEENPKEFLSLLDMSGGFIDNLLWLFTDNFPAEMVNDLNDLNNIPHPESEVIDVDATQNFDIAPASYALAEIHSHMFGQKKVKITETTRMKILDIFAEVEALKNVSLSRFDEYMDLYWFNFAQSFPIIHQVTFDPNESDVYLLVSILIIGMAHTADRLEYELSIVWNKKYRKVIREVIDEDTQLSLPIMQALILHNFSTRNFGDTTLCQISQIDHGSNLLYLKFSGFLDNLDEPVIQRDEKTTQEELYNQWQNWIIYETSKRTVFFEFICDTQHITFSKLELSAFDIKLELPCSDEVWNASTPEEFFTAYQIQPNNLVTRPKLNIHNNNHDMVNTNDDTREETEDKVTKVVMERYVTTSTPGNISSNSKVLGKWPSFLWGVKSLMMEYKDNQREFSLNCYSPFSRYIVLHSLIRICWHTRGHGLLDLGIISQNRLNDFFNKLEMAFANWKGYFDLHIKLYDDQVKARDALQESGEREQYMKESGIRSQVLLNNYGPTNACWANLSLFYTGLFTLYADISSLLKFANEFNVTKKLSNKVHQDMKDIEYERNDILVEQWARSSNAEIAVVEACKFLILVFKHEETINTFSHVPPSVYIAILIIWSFEKKNVCKSTQKKDSKRLYPDPDQYFDKRDYVIGIVARNDAKQYLDLITNLANEDESTDDTQREKIFRQRQYYTVGVVCYALFLLRHCKWLHSIDIVRKLEHIVNTFK